MFIIMIYIRNWWFYLDIRDKYLNIFCYVFLRLYVEVIKEVCYIKLKYKYFFWLFILFGMYLNYG